MTTYVSKEVDLGNGFTIYIDGNSKITNGNGTYENPVANAFSLPHISTCPGATDKCMKACYVWGLEKNAPEVYAKYRDNERIIHKILLLKYMEALNIANNFGKYISKNCTGGFRWHVSGDIMSVNHSEFIRQVCIASKNVTHWIYTRSGADVLSNLTDRTFNLVVNISADADNYQQARLDAQKYGVRLCYFTHDGNIPEDMLPGEVIFPDYSFRGRELGDPTKHLWWQGLSAKHKRMVCPADFFGQSEEHRCGPCNKCLRKIYE